MVNISGDVRTIDSGRRNPSRINVELLVDESVLQSFLWFPFWRSTSTRKDEVDFFRIFVRKGVRWGGNVGPRICIYAPPWWYPPGLCAYPTSLLPLTRDFPAEM